MDVSQHEIEAPLLTTPQQWRSFLGTLDTSNDRPGQGWAGTKPATNDTVTATERRLGVRFPPGFRSFLLTSDGGPGVGGWVEALHRCEEIAWFRDTDSGEAAINVLVDIFGELDPGDEDADDPDPREVFERTILVASGQDFWLLDPARSAADGEWIAWRYRASDGELERFARFADLFHFCAEEVKQSPPSAHDTEDVIPVHGRGLEPHLPNLAAPLGFAESHQTPSSDAEDRLHE